MKTFGYIGRLALISLVVFACSKDALKEEDASIPVNPNPGGQGLPPNEQWAWVGKYPGEISNSVQRLSDVKVSVSGDYTYKESQTQAKPLYWQSTGLYVPPAEQVVIEVPAGVTGLHYQIGIADCEIPAGSSYKRYAKVSKTGVLEPGTNTIFSNFGGPLYFYYDNQPASGSIDVNVTGCVKSLDYELDVTDLNAWYEEVQSSENEMIWGELIGKRVIFTLPIATLQKIERPDILLNFWDNVIENDCDVVGGVASGETQQPWRIYVDVQFPTGGIGSSSVVSPYYPMAVVTNTADSLDKSIINMSSPLYLSTKIEKGDTLFMKGLVGMYATAWNSGDYLSSSLNSVSALHFYQKNGKWSDLVSSYGTYKEPIAPSQRCYLPTNADKISMSVCLAQHLGWDFFSYASSKSKEEVPDTVPQQYKNDLVAIYASEYSGEDLTEFFEGYKYPVSCFGQKYMKQYPAPATKWWESGNMQTQPVASSTAVGPSYPKVLPTIDTLLDRSNWAASADSEQQNEPGEIARCLDGLTSTYYHSKWGDSGQGHTGFPIALTFTFDDEQDISYLYFQHRNQGNPPMKAVTFLIKKDKDLDNWEEVEGGRIFYLCSERNANFPKHYIFLGETVSCYGIRIMLLHTFSWTAGDPTPGTAENVAIAEIGFGVIK